MSLKVESMPLKGMPSSTTPFYSMPKVKRAALYALAGLSLISTLAAISALATAGVLPGAVPLIFLYVAGATIFVATPTAVVSYYNTSLIYDLSDIHELRKAQKVAKTMTYDELLSAFHSDDFILDHKILNRVELWEKKEEKNTTFFEDNQDLIERMWLYPELHPNLS